MTILIFLEKVAPAGDWNVRLRWFAGIEMIVSGRGCVSSGAIVSNDSVMIVVFQGLSPLSPHFRRGKGIGITDVFRD